MQAIICSAYSNKAKDVLTLQQIPKPDTSKLKADDVCVKVHASSINFGDRVLMSGEPWLARLALGMFKPYYKTFGCDYAGKVVAVGANVTEFKVGDAVYGDCGDAFGGWAEYVVCPKKSTQFKPTNLSFLEAACIPSAGCTALQAVRDIGKMQAGESVMVHGAGGGVGHFAIQISKALGAGSVAAYTSGHKMEQATKLGADAVFDYKATDFLKQGKKYDLVVDAGAYRSVHDYKAIMEDDAGKYVFCGGSIWRLLDVGIRGPWVRNKQQTMANFLVSPNSADLDVMKKMAEAGQLKPVIESRVSLDQVAQAMSDYVEKGVSGKIAIAIHNADDLV